MITNSSTIEKDQTFIKLIGSRYHILRCLFPNKTLSFTELSVESGVHTGNLSRYLIPLEENDIVIIQKKIVGGRERSFITLSVQTAELIQCVINLLGQSELPFLPDISLIDGMLDNLLDKDIQSLAADHVQRISQKYKVPVESGFYDFIREKGKTDDIKPILATLLKALRGMIFNHDEESRKKIMYKVVSSLETIRDTEPQKNYGTVAQKILKEFNWDILQLETLKNKYLETIEAGEEAIKSHLLREQILERYPDQKMYIRVSLIERAKGADRAVRSRIENEFPLWY